MRKRNWAPMTKAQTMEADGHGNLPDDEAVDEAPPAADAERAAHDLDGFEPRKTHRAG